MAPGGLTICSTCPVAKLPGQGNLALVSGQKSRGPTGWLTQPLYSPLFVFPIALDRKAADLFQPVGVTGVPPHPPSAARGLPRAWVRASWEHLSESRQTGALLLVGGSPRAHLGHRGAEHAVRRLLRPLPTTAHRSRVPGRAGCWVLILPRAVCGATSASAPCSSNRTYRRRMGESAGVN